MVALSGTSAALKGETTHYPASDKLPGEGSPHAYGHLYRFVKKCPSLLSLHPTKIVPCIGYTWYRWLERLE